MRNISKTLATIGGLVLLSAGTASAADMRDFPPSAPLLQNAPLLVDEFSSGWYLRGDVGYRWNKLDDVTGIGPTPTVQDNKIDDSWMIGGGVGYKWEWFRTDLTLDYGFKSKFASDSPLAGNDFTAKIDNVTGLVNVYGDLGTWWGFTPYIGGGIGFARLQVGDFRVKSSGVDDAPSNDKWNFAWAYMAGISYKVTGNYLIDLGYRHVNMGDITTGVDSIGDKLTFKKLTSDEVRLGFRYVLD
jgi:Opacity protein and related surface antigens